jgi:Zn-dependent membrane protease YugP
MELDWIVLGLIITVSAEAVFIAILFLKAVVLKEILLIHVEAGSHYKAVQDIHYSMLKTNQESITFIFSHLRS